MNPQEFCREKGYETALLLTYSFDPLFFERVVLRDLRVGGTSECVVVADRDELEEALPRAAGQVNQLGRRYRLVAPLEDARQHAKLMLRAGRAGALVWVGSNNLTAGGWGGNHELATAWRIDPSDGAGVSLFSGLVKGVAPLLNDRARETAKRLLSLPWVSGGADSTGAGHTVLLSSGAATLAEQLAARWAGRSFESVEIMTGSTDRNGAFLKWAAEVFGVRSAVVGLYPGNSDFDAGQLGRLPLDVRIVPLPGAPTPHAKFYFFQGRDGAAAVVGSANCSAAAWRAPVGHGGNRELVVIYDHCDRADFSEALKKLEGGGQSPGEVLEGHEEEDGKNPEKGPAVRVVDFFMDQDTGELMLVIAPGKSGVSSVTAWFGELEHPLSPDGQEEHTFTGMPPDIEAVPGGNSTHFARLVFKLEDGSQWETVRWLDEEHELSHLSIGRHMAALERLDRAEKPGEQKEIVESIAELARDLCIAGKFPDPSSGTGSNQTKGEAPRPAVDPHELVKSILEVQKNPPVRMGLQGPGGGLPVNGLLRVLFGGGRPASDMESEEAFADDDSEEPQAAPEKENGGPKQKAKPADALRKTLIKSIDTFLDRFAGEKFLQTCSATQFSQAAAFVLGVVVLDRSGRWTDDETRRRWMEAVFCQLFTRRVTDKDGKAHKGALALLKARYEAEGRLPALKKVLGNGLLWSALVAAFTRLKGKADDPLLKRELYLGALFSTPVLYADANPEALAATLGGYHENDAAELLSEAERAAGLVRDLEKCLLEEYENLRGSQAGLRSEPGDLCYHPQHRFGWISAAEPVDLVPGARVPLDFPDSGKPTPFKAGFFCDVRLAGSHSERIAKLLGRLQQTP